MASRLTTEQLLHLLDAEDFRLSESKGREKGGDEVYSYSGRLVTDPVELTDLCQHGRRMDYPSSDSPDMISALDWQDSSSTGGRRWR